MTTKRSNVLVTGGVRGIGHAIALQLQRQNFAVTVTGTAPNATLADGLEYFPADFLNSDSLDALVEHIRLSNFDILINNAGINSIAPFESIPEKDYEEIQLVNVHAPFRLMQAVVPGMKQRGYGRIVNITSIFGVISKAQRASYSASKFALDGMTAALAAEVAANGILANCVSPGFIDTELTRSILSEEQIVELAAQVPIGRLGKPEEIASLVGWLASDSNSYVSGQNIVIDGGFTRV